MEIYISLLVALVGVLMFALAANPKLVEIGRIAFFCGLFVFLFTLGTGRVNLFTR